MDAAEYRHFADQLGACDVERQHALDNARFDLARRPGTVHGRDQYQIAADALTAFRAQPARPQPVAEFAHHAWAPGHIVSAEWPETDADRFMKWYRKATAGR
jgi:hypothetical protein